MDSKIDSIEIMINDEADEVIKEPFDSLKNKYQNNLESMKVSDFVFDYVHLLCYKSHKINLNRSGWNRKPPGWIKNKKGAINPINEKDNKCFQYAVTVALNHEEIKKDPQRIKEIKPFIKKFKCEWIKFPSEEDDWKKFEKINVTIPFNILYAKKKKYILFMFQNITQMVKKQVALLMMPNGTNAKLSPNNYYGIVLQ